MSRGLFCIDKRPHKTKIAILNIVVIKLTR